MAGICFVLDGIFVLCDEVLIRQQRAAELLKSLGRQLNDLVNDTGLTLIFGLLLSQFCLNNHFSTSRISVLRHLPSPCQQMKP